jgi:7-cyano-7-deazaguanine synthase
MKGSIVLLSGGLDSTVNFKLTVDRGEARLVLTFDYGQRSATREVAAARAMARRYRVPFRAMKLGWLGDITHTALVDRSKSLPHLRPRDLDDIKHAALRSAKAVWVPNRNAVFINIAAAFAESLGCAEIVVGFNAEEAATFPDNSRDFLVAVNRSLRLSTLAGVRVVSHTTGLKKADVVRLGRRIGAPLDLMWSCYEGGRTMCWRCESCLRLRRALETTGNWEWFLSLAKRTP